MKLLFYLSSAMSCDIFFLIWIGACHSLDGGQNLIGWFLLKPRASQASAQAVTALAAMIEMTSSPSLPRYTCSANQIDNEEDIWCRMD